MNIKRFILSAILLPALALAARGADVKDVKGEWTWYDDGSHSKVECMRLAAEQARIDALAREFGTIVSQDIMQADRIIDSREQSDFLAISSTEVRGQWICDNGDPQYEISTDKDGNYVVKCTVRGTASAITNESTEFSCSVLRNAPTLQAADNRFRNGDSMYLYFNGSADGYLAAFLEDESGNVCLLLPYTADNATRLKVRKNKEYIFFSPTHGEDNGVAVDEIYLTADDRTEYNRLYVVYSPEFFSRPVMESTATFPVMKSADFSRWLSKARRNDPRMGVKAMNLLIAPNS